MGFDPQEPLTDSGEHGRLSNGVGVEVVKLHPVVVRMRPHEMAHQHSKPPLMEGVKLTTQPTGGAGSCSSPGAINSSYGPWRRGRRLDVHQCLQVIVGDGGDRSWVAGRKDIYFLGHQRWGRRQDKRKKAARAGR
jgi:hypothetical protein